MLTWDNPNNAAIIRYDYRVGTTSSGTTMWSPDWGKISGSGATTTSHAVAGLDGQHELHVRGAGGQRRRARG